MRVVLLGHQYEGNGRGGASARQGGGASAFSRRGASDRHVGHDPAPACRYRIVEPPQLVGTDGESGIFRQDARGLAGPVVIHDPVYTGEVHPDDISLVIEDEAAARMAGKVEGMLDDPAVLRRGHRVFEGPQRADRAAFERGDGDRDRRPRFFFGKPDRADRLSHAQPLDLVPGQEERRVRQVGVDDQQGHVGRTGRAVVAGMNPEVLQPVRIGAADLRARLDGKGPRVEIFDEPGRDEDGLHDVGVGPDGVPEVRDESRPQHVVLPLDLHANRIDRVPKVLVLDDVRPVQRLTRFALRTRRASRAGGARGPNGAGLSRRSGRTLRTLASEKHQKEEQAGRVT